MSHCEKIWPKFLQVRNLFQSFSVFTILGLFWFVTSLVFGTLVKHYFKNFFELRVTLNIADNVVIVALNTAPRLIKFLET